MGSVTHEPGTKAVPPATGAERKVEIDPAAVTLTPSNLEAQRFGTPLQGALRTNAISLAILGVVTFAGFVPAMRARATTGVWFMNAWLQDAYNPHQMWIALHAVSALLLLGLLIVQGVTGLLPKPSESRVRCVPTPVMIGSRLSSSSLAAGATTASWGRGSCFRSSWLA